MIQSISPTSNEQLFALATKLQQHVLDPLKAAFVAKEEIVDLMGICLTARKNLFLLGPPGTAKSALVHRLASLIQGESFDYLLTRFTEPSELFGPFDIRKLRDGDLVTNTQGMLPEAALVFLDELLNANSAILNGLLGVLNECGFDLSIGLDNTTLADRLGVGPGLSPWTLAVLHPSLGLIAAAASDVFVASELIARPTILTNGWDDAQPGSVAEPRVTGIKLIIPASPSEVMEAMRDDIGTKQIKGDDNDGPFDLEGTHTENVRRAIANWFYRTVQNAIPTSVNATRDSLGSKLNDWAQRKLDQQRNRERNNELERLAELLKSMPDEALKYALPLWGLTRGLTQGGSSLTPNSTNFDLNALSRASPSSNWDASDSLHERLTRQYRQLAQREMELGRYRRAAYIYGHLLGDFQSTAFALERGKFFAEAASIHRDKLNNKMAAAECLERGGLLVDAAVMFEEIQAYERAGDLYQKLENVDRARQLYERVIEGYLLKQDVVRAAATVEQKLNDMDRSMKLLHGAWPSHAQAEPALAAWFRMGEKFQRHDELLDQTRAFWESSRDEPASSSLARVLAGVATDSQHQSLRELAAITTRKLAGYAVSDRPDDLEAKELLKLVRSLATHDVLLRRDARRFENTRKVGKAKRTDNPEPVKAKWVHVPRYSVDVEGVEWLDAQFQGKNVLAMGRRENDVVLARRNDKGIVEVEVMSAPGAGRKEWRLSVDVGRALVVSPGAESQLMPRLAMRQQGQSEVSVNSPPRGLESQGPIIAAAYDMKGQLLQLSRDPVVPLAMQLQWFAPSTRIAIAVLSGTSESQAGLDRAWMGAAGQQVIITFGSGVAIAERHRDTLYHQLPDEIDRLWKSRSQSHSEPAIVRLKRGDLWTVSSTSQQPHRFRSQWTDPQVAFLPNGMVAIVDLKSGTLFQSRNGHLEFKQSINALPEGKHIVALLPDLAEGSILAMLESGRVLRWMVE
jgi:tetratricopeptide (TPR) repeat protein